MTFQGVPPESDPGVASGIQKGIVSRLARVQSTRVVFAVMSGAVLVVAALLLVVVMHIGPQDNLVIQGLQSLAGYDAKAPFGYERINPVNGKCPKGYRLDAKKKCIKPLAGPAITPTPTATPTPAAPAGSQKIAIASASGNSVGTYVAANAIDGKTNTMWNSGGFAPQSITLDLGNFYTVSSLRFNAQKTPAGAAVHTISAGACAAEDSYTQSFTENLTGGQWQDVPTTFGGPVRYITVLTTSSPSWVAWGEIEAYGTPASFTGSCGGSGGGSGGGTGGGGGGGPVGCLGGAVSLSSSRVVVGGTIQAYSTIGTVAVTFSSNNAAVASVTGSGVTGVAAGTTSIAGRYVYGGRTCYLTAADVTVTNTAPKITAIQGYDSTTRTYTNGKATAGEYVVLYGSFADTGNSVIVTGTTGSISFQSSTQINVRIGNSVGQASFAVRNNDGTSNTQSIQVVSAVTPTPTPTPTPISNAPIITGIQGYNATTGEYNNSQAVAGQYVVLYGNFSANNDNTVNTGLISAQNANQINVRIGSATGTLSFVVSNPNGSSNTKSIQVVSAVTPTPTPTPTPANAQYDVNASVADATVCPAVNDRATIVISGSVTGATPNASVSGDGVILSKVEGGAVIAQLGFIETSPGNYTTNAGASVQTVSAAGTYSVTLRFGGQYRTSRTVIVSESCAPTPTPTPTPTPANAQYDLNVQATDASVCPAINDRATISMSGSVTGAAANSSVTGDGVILSKDGTIIAQLGFIQTSPGNYTTNAGASLQTVSAAGTYSVALHFAGQYRTSRTVIVSESCAPTPTPTPTPTPSVAVYNLSASASDATVCAATNDRATINFSGSVSNASPSATVSGDGVILSKDGTILSQAGFIETTAGNYVTNAGSSFYTASAAGTYSVTLRFAGQYRTSRLVVINENCPPPQVAAGSLSATQNPIIVYSGGVGATVLTARNLGDVDLTLDADGVSYNLLPSTTRQVVITVFVGTSKLYRLSGGSYSQTILVAAQAATP